MPDRERVLAAIHAAYRSLSEPHFGFVRLEPDERSAAIVAALGRRFDAEDLTDVNTDVSFRYRLRGRHGSYFLSLSMVGPFALLLRARGDGLGTPIESTEDARDRHERRIVEMLLDAGLELLDAELLGQPVDLALSARDEGDVVTLFQALISDEDGVPWPVKPFRLRADEG